MYGIILLSHTALIIILLNNYPLKMKKYYFLALSFALPFVAGAQIDAEVPNAPGNPDVDGFLVDVLGWINTLVPILIGLGVLAFLWGVVKFIMSGDAEEKKESAKQTMIYGIIGIFVMVAIWGIIALLADTLNVGVGGELEQAPQIQGS